MNNKSPMLWDDAAKARLRALAADGLSGAQAAIEMGCSRNAVMGAAHRYKIQFNCSTTPAAIEQRKQSRQPRRKPSAVLTAETADVLYVPPPSDPGSAVPFYLSTGCRWILDEEPAHDARTCNAKRVIGRQLCAYHCLITYVAPKRRAETRPSYVPRVAGRKRRSA